MRGLSLLGRTTKEYEAIFARFKKFVLRLVGKLTAVTDELRKQYCEWRWLRTGQKAESMGNELTAIDRIARRRELPVEGRSFELNEALKGWKRVTLTKGLRRRPLPKDLVVAYAKAMRQPTLHDLRLMEAVMACAFFGMWRPGEYAAATLTTKKFFQKGWVEFLPSAEKPELAVVSFPPGYTKTNHFKKHGEKSLVHCTCGEGLCALHALHRYMQLYAKEQSDEEPLFRWSNGRRLLYDDMLKLCAAIADAAGEKREDFKPHSFRSGGATFYFEKGVPEQLIRELGRWSATSDTLYKYYIRPRMAANAALLSLYVLSETDWQQSSAIKQSPAFCALTMALSKAAEPAHAGQKKYL